MSQLENVQRGAIFLLFLYILIQFVFIVFRLVKNTLDLTASDDEGGEAYKDNSKPKEPKADQESVDKLEKKEEGAKKEEGDSEGESFVAGANKKFGVFAIQYMPILIPFYINICTGTSYGFLMFLFFVTKGSFILFNTVKLHEGCVTNPTLKMVLLNLGYILTFFMWINVWATTASTMPYYIV